MKTFPSNTVCITISVSPVEGYKESIIREFHKTEGKLGLEYVFVHQRYFSTNQLNEIQSYYKVKDINKFNYFSICEEDKLPEIRQQIKDLIRNKATKTISSLNTILEHLKGEN